MISKDVSETNSGSRAFLKPSPMRFMMLRLLAIGSVVIVCSSERRTLLLAATDNSGVISIAETDKRSTKNHDKKNEDEKPDKDDLDAVSFRRDIGPLLVKNCQVCHGAKQSESNYRLDTFEHLKSPGDLENATITAGDLDNSEIYRLLISDDPDERMPRENDPFSEDEIDLVKRWIEQGAQFDGPAEDAKIESYIPKPKQNSKRCG